ncbi:hypothetical protein Tco_1380648, partial [Tanacetum coccineum]
RKALDDDDVDDLGSSEEGNAWIKGSVFIASGIRSIRRIKGVQYGVLVFSWSGDDNKYLPESFMNRRWIRHMSSSGYGVLLFKSSWFLVKFRRRYAISSLMNTMYWLSEQQILDFFV